MNSCYFFTDCLDIADPGYVLHSVKAFAQVQFIITIHRRQE